jgi:hypothetical protein
VVYKISVQGNIHITGSWSSSSYIDWCSEDDWSESWPEHRIDIFHSYYQIFQENSRILSAKLRLFPSKSLSILHSSIILSPNHM